MLYESFTLLTQFILKNIKNSTITKPQVPSKKGHVKRQ